MRAYLAKGVMLAFSAVLVTGCSGPSISLSGAELNVLPCEDRSPVNAADLGDSTRATCDLAGVEMVFPDGYALVAPQIMASSAEAPGDATSEPVSTYTYSILNLGVYGLVAARGRNDGSASEWWGTRDGLEKAATIYGVQAPTIWK